MILSCILVLKWHFKLWFYRDLSNISINFPHSTSCHDNIGHSPLSFQQLFKFLQQDCPLSSTRNFSTATSPSFLFSKFKMFFPLTIYTGLLHIVMNLRVPQKAGEYPDQLSDLQFPKKDLVDGGPPMALPSDEPITKPIVTKSRTNFRKHYNSKMYQTRTLKNFVL
jgi:hypothetical protein